MDYSKFFEAVYPPIFHILGAKLLPFTLGHYFLLSRIESPFISDSEEPDPADLTAAVWFCSRPYSAGEQSLHDASLHIKVKDLIAKATGSNSLLARFRIAKPAKIVWADKAALFATYLESHRYCPAVSFKDSDSRAINFPFPQMVKLFLMSRLHMTEAQAMNYPWSKCLSDFVGLRAMDGDVEILDEDELQAAQEQADAMFKKLNPQMN